MEVKLVMFKASGERKDLPITKETTLIGRAEKCDLHVPLLSISREHCELTKSDATLTVTDLDSSNGTHVNNRKVEEVELKAGDRVTVGPIIFTVQIDGVPDQIEEAKEQTQEFDLSSEESQSGIFDLDDTSFGEVGLSEESGEIDPMAALEGLDFADDDDDD